MRDFGGNSIRVPKVRMNINSPSQRSSDSEPAASPVKSGRLSDTIFFLIMGGLSACFILLIVLLIVADVLHRDVA